MLLACPCYVGVGPGSALACARTSGTRTPSRAIRWIDAVELAQQARPFRPERGVRSGGEPGGVLRHGGCREREGGVARHRQHLRLARELQIEQVAERERNAFSDREQPVVA